MLVTTCEFVWSTGHENDSQTEFVPESNAAQLGHQGLVLMLDLCSALK